MPEAGGSGERRPDQDVVGAGAVGCLGWYRPTVPPPGS